MTTAEGTRRKGYWATIILYGLLLAGLVILLKYAQYRYLLRDLRVEVYVGLVAVLFTALGVWLGSRLIARRTGMPVVPAPKPDAEALRRSGISPREMDVLRLMAEGRSNQEIADRLFISLPTVKSHSSSLFGKLGAQRRTEAVHRAKTLGIIQ